MLMRNDKRIKAIIKASTKQLLSSPISIAGNHIVSRTIRNQLKLEFSRTFFSTNQHANVFNIMGT
jgi:hypothetical protein